METEQVRLRIVFLDRGVFPFDLKRPRFPHEWIEYRTTPQEDVVDRMHGATIAITNRLRLGRAELEKLSDLRMVAVAATGYDQIDIVACRELGVVVSNLRGWCDPLLTLGLPNLIITPHVAWASHQAIRRVPPATG